LFVKSLKNIFHSFSDVAEGKGPGWHFKWAAIFESSYKRSTSLMCSNKILSHFCFAFRTLDWQAS